MKLTAGLLALLGALIGGIGIYLGTASVTRYSTNCGTAFGGVSNDAIGADYTRAIEADNQGLSLDPGSLTQVSDACKSAVGDRNTLAMITTVPGGVLLATGLVLAVVAYNRREEEEDAPTYRPPRAW